MICVLFLSIVLNVACVLWCGLALRSWRSRMRGEGQQRQQPMSTPMMMRRRMRQQLRQERLRVVAPRLRVGVVVMVVLMEAVVVLVAVPRLWCLAAVLLALPSTRLWLQREAAWVYGPSRR